jgi:hypothetical protein
MLSILTSLSSSEDDVPSNYSSLEASSSPSSSLSLIFLSFDFFLSFSGLFSYTFLFVLVLFFASAGPSWVIY